MDSSKSVLGQIVGLALAAIFLGTIFIAGLQMVVTANTTGLDATQLIIWGVLGLILILAAVILVLKYVGVKI